MASDALPTPAGPAPTTPVSGGAMRGADRLARTLRRAIAADRADEATNRLTPYRERLFEQLSAHPPALLAAALARLPVEDVRRVFYEQFRDPPAALRVAIAARLPAGTLGALVAGSVHGVDLPREAARLLAALPVDTAANALREAGPAGAAVAAHLPPETAAALLASRPRGRRARALRAAAGGSRPAVSLSPSPPVRGRRRARDLAAGLRWVQILEEVEGDGPAVPVRVDLLEVDSRRFRLEAKRALEGEALVPARRLGDVFGAARRDGPRPAEERFGALGLVRLADEVARTGAAAGINGGFYVDYGHYLDAADIGLDLAGVPGLHFGDVIGWLVSGGVEVNPPVLRRAALLVDGQGFRIRRVGIRALRLPGGDRLPWPEVNPRRPRAGAPAVYHCGWGPRTPAVRGRVDVVVAGHRVAAVRPGGGAAVPLTGFVLSLPEGDPHLGPLRPRAWVEPEADLAPGTGPVTEAMACGPQLVRDGRVDLDLDAEDFGDKDTYAVPFSLTRRIESFRAGRSFAALRGHTLILGAVSGTALGSGPPRVSAGMTFGELARLCADLDVDDALGLDGGGSSSLVGRMGGGPKVLNVPTGGSDVPEGAERFINTYWLVHPTT